MENLCDLPILQQDHTYSRGRRTARRAGRKPGGSKCPCCRDHKHSATAANAPQKRRRTSAAPPKPPAGPPEALDRVPAPPPSTSAADVPSLPDSVPRSAIPPADLPVASYVVPGPEPSTARLHDDAPLSIHNRSVEDYQQLYQQVVDDMLRYKTGRLRPYSLELGRRLKQKLWERLDRPTTSTSADQGGVARVDVSYGVGVYPPLYDVDTLGEPEPKKPPKKRSRQ